MEGLKFRLLATGIGLVAFGVFLNVLPRQESPGYSESFLASHAPASVEGYAFQPGPNGADCTYRMDQRTYDTLEPDAILARVYSKGLQMYDVVLIASRSKDSFHDPRQCFSSQGWVLREEDRDTVQTKTRGVVPITLVKMSGQDRNDMYAAYFYMGPGGFKGSNKSIKTSMFWEQLLHGGGHLNSMFYRFIPMNPGATVSDLKQFIASYLDRSNQTSDGLF